MSTLEKGPDREKRCCRRVMASEAVGPPWRRRRCRSWAAGTPSTLMAMNTSSRRANSRNSSSRRSPLVVTLKWKRPARRRSSWRPWATRRRMRSLQSRGSPPKNTMPQEPLPRRVANSELPAPRVERHGRVVTRRGVTVIAPHVAGGGEMQGQVHRARSRGDGRRAYKAPWPSSHLTKSCTWRRRRRVDSVTILALASDKPAP